MSDRINTATHRITKPRALAMRTILGAFSFLVCWKALGCHRLGRTLPLLPVARMREPPFIAPHNGIRSAGVGGRLHGEGTAARSGLIPLPAQPPPLLTAAASPPGSRFN